MNLNLNTLPADAIGKILGHMPFADVIAYRSVCRRWKTVIENQQFLRLYFPKFKSERCPSTLNPRAIVRLVNLHEEVEQLSLKNCMNITDSLLKQIKVRTHVLKIKNCMNITSDGVISLLSLMKSPARIKIGNGAPLDLAAIFNFCRERKLQIQDLSLKKASRITESIKGRREVNDGLMERFKEAFIQYVNSALLFSSCRLNFWCENWATHAVLVALAQQNIYVSYLKMGNHIAFDQWNNVNQIRLTNLGSLFVNNTSVNNFYLQPDIFIKKLDVTHTNLNQASFLINKLAENSTLKVNASGIKITDAPLVISKCRRLTILCTDVTQTDPLFNILKKASLDKLKLLKCSEPSYLSVIKNFPKKFTLEGSGWCDFNIECHSIFQYFPKEDVCLTLKYPNIDQTIIDAIAASAIQFKKLRLYSCYYKLNLKALIEGKQLDYCKTFAITSKIHERDKTLVLLANKSIRKLSIDYDEFIHSLLLKKNNFRHLTLLWLLGDSPKWEMIKQLMIAKPNLAIRF